MVKTPMMKKEKTGYAQVSSDDLDGEGIYSGKDETHSGGLQGPNQMPAYGIGPRTILARVPSQIDAPVCRHLASRIAAG
jgi:hypothetical protein